MQLPPDISEREFTSAVIAAAQALGWRVAHFRTARTRKGWATPTQGDAAGFPDLVLVRNGRLLFIELKTSHGRLQPNQKQWLHDLAQVQGVRVLTVRPAGWHTLLQILTDPESDPYAPELLS